MNFTSDGPAQGFIQALARNGMNDEATRGAFADWLEERAEPGDLEFAAYLRHWPDVQRGLSAALAELTRIFSGAANVIANGLQAFGLSAQTAANALTAFTQQATRAEASGETSASNSAEASTPKRKGSRSKGRRGA